MEKTGLTCGKTPLLFKMDASDQKSFGSKSMNDEALKTNVLNNLQAPRPFSFCRIAKRDRFRIGLARSGQNVGMRLPKYAYQRSSDDEKNQEWPEEW